MSEKNNENLAKEFTSIIIEIIRLSKASLIAKGRYELTVTKR